MRNVPTKAHDHAQQTLTRENVAGGHQQPVAPVEDRAIFGGRRGAEESE